jgi:hypothetical protein
MTATTAKVRETRGANFGAQMPFEDINEPGCYVSNWSGHMIRVPEDALKIGHSPLIEILGRDTMVVTKLSCDPYIAISKARLLAADQDLGVNF